MKQKALLRPPDKETEFDHFGGGSEKMPAALELGRPATDQAQPRLVDQRRGLQGLSGLLARHFVRGELAERLINQWQQFLGGAWIPPLDGFKYLRHFAHVRVRAWTRPQLWVGGITGS